jgi:hypothetical protein
MPANSFEKEMTRLWTKQRSLEDVFEDEKDLNNRTQIAQENYLHQVKNEVPTKKIKAEVTIPVNIKW